MLSSLCFAVRIDLCQDDDDKRNIGPVCVGWKLRTGIGCGNPWIWPPMLAIVSWKIRFVVTSVSRCLRCDMIESPSINCLDIISYLLRGWVCILFGSMKSPMHPVPSGSLFFRHNTNYTDRLIWVTSSVLLLRSVSRLLLLSRNNSMFICLQLHALQSSGVVCTSTHQLVFADCCRGFLSRA